MTEIMHTKFDIQTVFLNKYIWFTLSLQFVSVNPGIQETREQ